MLKSFQESIMTPEGMKEFKNDIIGFVNSFTGFLNGLMSFAEIFTTKDLGRIKQLPLVNDFSSGPGQITHMMGPAGSFKLNPRDSVLATTNPIAVNDMMTGPAGSMGGNNQSQTINIVGNFRAKGDVMEAVLEGANNQPGYNSLQPRFG